MALIGTISGSVGASNALTSTTAISGTLVIADEPLGRFPSLQSGVKLFVSGNKTTLGADTPNAIFGGDTFVSGAFGTDSYIQMKPVNTLPIPTNTVASYIYTSGSTNDLYFTQYQPGTGFTNTTRLRWLEGVLTSGLLHGGVLSTANGTTTFSVTAGSGMIVVPNASTGTDPYPTIQYVQWTPFVSSSLIYSGTAQVTFVAIDSSGSLEQMNTAPTLRDYKNKIILGRILHQTGSVTNGVANAPAMSFSAAANIFDFVRPFGPLKVSGHVLAASGSTLSLTKTAGDSYSEGRNYAFDPSNPNTILAADDPDVTVSKIYYQHVSGSTTITNTGTGLAGFTVIDPARYNNNGTLDAVGNSEWTNQRVYWFPRAVNRALFVYYGSRKYGTLLEAVAGITVENFIEGGNTKDSAIFVGTISVKGNETSLTNATAQISQAGLFRGANSGGGGGGGSTPPAGSDTYVQFNDGGTAFGGAAGFTYNKSTDSITVAGNITGSRITSTATGDLTTGGGQVYLNGASSNRIDFSSLGTGDPAFNAPTAGTKVVLYPAAGASATDYAIGISPATLWQSIPAADTGMMFKWFGGTTTLAALSGSGNMEISGDLAVNGGDITSTAASLNISAGASGLAFQRSGTPFATFVSGASGPLQLVTLQASSGKSLVLAAGLGSTPPTPQVTVSGSYIDIRSSNSGTPSGVDFSNDVAGNPSSYLNITSGTYVPLGSTVSLNSAKIIAGVSRDLVLGSPSGQKVFISGSTVTLNAGASGISVQRDAAEILQVSSPGSPQVSITPGAGYTTANLFNVTTTTLNVAGGASVINIGAAGSAATFAGNITGSNALLSGDLAVNGGDITSNTPGAFNLLTGLSTGNTLNIGGSAATYNIGTSTGVSIINIGSGTNTALGANKTINIGPNTSGAGNVAVNIGSSGSNGRTTLHNDVYLTNGLIIGSPGAAGTNTLSLISSGNIIAKLDTDGSAEGHRFAIKDFRNIDQFSVGENGNAEVSGSLVVSGSTTFGATVERLLTSVGSTGTVSFDTTFSSIFYVNNPAGDILANFTNVPTTNNNRVVTTTVILSQSATARIVNGIQVNGVSGSILWANKVTPTGTANQQDVFGFSLIRSGSIWTVLGQMSTYG